MTKSEQKIQIAFYAPLKSPVHPNPSGDRKIAQLFIKALQQADFEVELASSLRSFDKKGDALRQRRMVALAEREAQRILRRWSRVNFQPKAWFCYHLYYKAPDLLGPIICRKLNIPYILAEASWAIKRSDGAWSLYHQWVDKALGLADKVFCINPVDSIALKRYYADRAVSPLVKLATFIDDPSPNIVTLSRRSISQQYLLDRNQPWLVCIAMMRNGDKFSSYQYLSEVIHSLVQPMQLLIIGDGEKCSDVQALFSGMNNVRFCGALHGEQIQSLLAHCEILVWPAVNEALGMVFLEAQQAGVAVIAGDQGGVNSVVGPDSGVLIPLAQSGQMSAALDGLLADSEKRRNMQLSAKKYVKNQHSLNCAADVLKLTLDQVMQ